MPQFIEWLDKGTLLRGVVKKADKGKIQGMTLSGRSFSLATKKFHLKHEGHGEASDFFAGIDQDATGVDLALLHETLGPGLSFSLGDLAACWFSEETPSCRSRSVMLAAVMAGAPWFRVDRTAGVSTATLEDLDRFTREQEARLREEKERQRLVRALTAGLEGEAAVLTGEEDLLKALEAELLGSAGFKGWPALDQAVQELTRKAACSRLSLVSSCLQTAGRLPEAYWVEMKSFHQAFFGRPLREESPGDRYPPFPGDETAQLERDTAEWLESLPPPLNPWAFSIDDEGVEEIDDALSVQALEEYRFRVGVHIAAPGLLVSEGSALHEEALRRCTTVYQPDLKWPLFPREVIALFSLKAGCRVPAVTHYFTFSSTSFELLAHEARIEALSVEANLTYDRVEEGLQGGFFPELDLLDEDPDRVWAWLDREPGEFPWAIREDLPGPLTDHLSLLVPLTRRLFVNRVREGASLFNRIEFKIKVNAQGEVNIYQRRRNSLAEGIVSELMILGNRQTAALLAEADRPAIYRTQGLHAQADLTVVPREHIGLGRTLYCWSTSPLRRYADLINQRQLGTLLGGRLTAFADASELLVRAKKTEFQNQAANRHQRRMERYWVLRYLQAGGEKEYPVQEVGQKDRRLARFEHLPLQLPLEPGVSSPRAFIPESIDLYTQQVRGRWV